LNTTDEMVAEIEETSRKMDANLKKIIKRKGKSVEPVLAAERSQLMAEVGGEGEPTFSSLIMEPIWSHAEDFDLNATHRENRWILAFSHSSG
jgi:hypothetical protein